MGKKPIMRSGHRNLRILKERVDSCRDRFSDDVEDIVHHLITTYPLYTHGIKQKNLLSQVKSILVQARKKRRREGDATAKRLNQKEEDEQSSRGTTVDHSFSSESESESESESRTMSDANAHCSTVSTSSRVEDSVPGEERRVLQDSLARGEEKNVDKAVAIGVSNTDTKIDANYSDKEKRGKEVVNSFLASEMNDRSYETVTFRDLGGMQDLLEDLRADVLCPLFNPHMSRWFGVRPVTGILLHGPPGCGKTSLAHAIANEANIPFYKISASEIVASISGASEENIRTLFNKAHRTAPSIVFIDEIDAITSTREDSQKGMERRIVTQLMTCMDASNKRIQPMDETSEIESSGCTSRYVLVIGATNRREVIDPALRRPGRFDLEIELGILDENARMDILTLLTRRCALDRSIDLSRLARFTGGFLGADLEALVNSAGKLAMRRLNRQRKSKLANQNENWWTVFCLPEELKEHSITMADFEEAVKLVQPSIRRKNFSTVPDVKWEDVGGLKSIREVFDLHLVGRIKHPEQYKKVGVDLGTGFLLYGPPGCGKTLIAKAAANAAGANFIHVKGPEILSKYVGESEQAIRSIFTDARRYSPCVLFFDEVDALTTGRGREGGWVVERLVNQFLIELDGADKRESVFVIGATNRPEVMDTAFLRPGRFDELLYVPLPSPDDRGLILKALAKGKAIDPEVDLNAIGKMKACENLSGADLMKLMKTAAKTALVEAKMMNYPGNTTIRINKNHFEEALSNIHPSVSRKQIEFYQIWSNRYKAT